MRVDPELLAGVNRERLFGVAGQLTGHLGGQLCVDTAADIQLRQLAQLTGG